MLAFLKEARVFKGCTPQELEDVADVSQMVTLKNGERVFEDKDPAEHLYMVANGAVELRFTVAHYRASKEITIDRILEKEAFGWSALTAPHTYSLSALAVEDAELLRVSAEELKRLSAENNHFGFVLMRNIAEVIAERFELVQKVLIDVIQQSLREKEL
jgi:CRP-like cAMP-binding protein